MVSNELDTIDLVKTLELGEIAAMLDFLDAAPNKLKKAAGIEYHTEDSVLISIMSQTEVLIFNRVVGLGLDDNVTESEFDAIIARFKAAGAKRFFVQLSPIAIQRGVQDILSSRGFNHHNNWIRLYRNTEPILKVHTDLQVKQIGIEDATKFAEIVTSAFSWPPDLSSGWRLWLGGPAGVIIWHSIAIHRWPRGPALSIEIPPGSDLHPPARSIAIAERNRRYWPKELMMPAKPDAHL